MFPLFSYSNRVLLPLCIPTTCCDVTETRVTDVKKQTAMTAMHKIIKGGINTSRGVDSMLLGYYTKILIVSLIPLDQL